MANLFESRGGGFAGDTGETQAPEYRTVRRPKFSSNPGRESDIYKDRKEEYIRDIEKKYGFTENRWKFLIGKYFDFNRDLIDPNQEGLDRELLEEIFNEYGAKTSLGLDINSRLDSMFSSKQKESVITEELGSPQVAEDSGVKNTDLQSIKLSPEQQAEIEARKANYKYPTRIAREGDYVRGMTLPEWLQIEEGSSEHTTLIKGIKTNGIMPSLGKLGSNIKDQKANNDISGEYLAFINATREFYGLAPYVSEPEELVLENPTVNQLEFDLDGQQEPILAVDPESGTTPASEGLAEGGVNETKKLTRADFAPMPEDPYDIKNNDLEALNNLFVSKADQFPNGKYVDIRNWADWTPITVVKPENINDPNLQWSITKGNNNELIGEFPSEEDAEAEFNRIKNEDKQKALDLLRKARNFAIGVDLDTPWSDVIDVSSEPVMVAESAVTPLLDAETTSGVGTPNPEVDKVQATDSENGGEVLPGSDELRNALNVLVEEIATQESSSVDKNSGSLQQELDRLIEVGAQKLQREQTTENIFYQVDREKLERFKDNARQAISSFQQFVRDHSSPADKSNPQIQERYQLLEKYAWNSLYSLAHLLDGEIATLPQDRDIQLSHPGGVNTRQYLEARGYKFDENGDITHITDNGVEIELNRAMKTDSLIKSKRPSHIVYDKSISLDNDINYQGYLVRGLNQQTPDFIVGVLDKNNLEPVIVDETGQSTVPTTEAKQYPWSSESSGETEFEKIFADSLSRNENAQGNNEIPDPWVEEAKVTDPETPEQTEGGENLPIDNPDRGSLYCQEIQLWNNIQALENRQKENPKDELVKVELDQAKQAYQEFRSTVSSAPEQDKFKQFLELRELYAQAESENTRGRIQKLFRLKRKNNSELEDIRSQYNEALEALLKTEASIDVEGKIKEMFSDEVQRLSGERVVQTKELQEKNQSGLDRALNPLKDRIFNWYIKNKSAVGVANLGLFATSTLLAFTGAGIPLAGAVNALRQAILYPMAVASGISSRELIRSKFEDENTNLNLNIKKFNLKTNFEFLKFKGGITKLVDKSLRDNYIQNSSDEDLSKLVSTLESYYGLNGGKFTELTQQKAYEMGLNELGARLERANNQNADEQDISSKSSSVDVLDYKFDFKNTKEFKIKTVDGLVTRISQDRISALNDQKNKRLVANVAGTALGSSLLFNLFAQDLQLNKPNLGDSASTTGGATGSGPGEASAPEAGAVATPEVKPTPSPEIPPTGASAEEALRQAQALAQDVSSLDSAETIWGEIAKQLGTGASEAQIQEAVEKYLGSIKGQDTIFKLAQQTEGGRELLSQFRIDDAGEMASLSKEQLLEISKYLAPGELKGLTELSLDNLDALDPAVATTPSSAGAPTIEPGSTESPAPPAGPEVTGAEPLSPPAAETPVTPQSTELPPVASTEFTRGVSEALGATNLTETQLQEVIYSFATSEQGSTELYNQIISNEEGARFLSGFGVNNAADFANLRPDEVYEIAQTVGVENLDKLLGFELNEIILSKFEDAPDMVELARGTRPLDVVNQYISSEIGNLPYDSTLGQQVLNTYLDTADGKQWLYDAIVNNPDVDNQNIQLFREYLRFKDIKSPEDFVSKFNWAEFSGNKNIPTSAFWNQTRLPNGVDKLQPLSTLLKPSRMLGIKDAVRQVLTRQ